MTDSKKKKLFILFIFEVFFVLAVGLYFYSNERPLIQGISIKRIIGKVLYLREDKLEALTTTTKFQDGDIVITGTKSDVIFEFGHQSTLKLMPKSRLNLAEVVLNFHTGRPFRLVIPEGSIFLDFNNDRKHGLIVLTKLAALDVRGTQFVVSSDPQSSTVKVAVLEGSVEALRESAQEKSLIHFGEGLEIKETAPLGKAGREKWVEMIRWEKLAEGTQASEAVKENLNSFKEKQALQKSLRDQFRNLRNDSEELIAEVYKEVTKQGEPVAKEQTTSNSNIDEVIRMKKAIDKRNDELDSLLQND